MTKGTPLVSIVIPVYNCAEFVEEAIDSVLGQSYSAVELIVLDDGSTDGTDRILRKYGDRFRWERHNNMGQAATLNKGWTMAQGDVLGYLSADDRLERDAIAVSVDQFIRHPKTQVTYCDYKLIDDKGRCMNYVAAPDFDLEEMICRIVCQPGPGAFFRRAVFSRIGGWDATLRQIPDYEFWLRAALLGPFHHIPLGLACFRVHGKSQSYAAPNVERSEEPVRVMRRFFERDDLPQNVSSLRANSLSAAHIIAARFHLRAGRFDSVRRHLSAAWRNHKGTTLSLRAFKLLGNGVAFRLGRVFRRAPST